MEMNTRLQVEHPVTEAVTGLDLVELQFRVAAGEKLPSQDIVLEGHAVEARVYAEDPAKGFLPSTGKIIAAKFPDSDGIRVDAGVERGTQITPFYDPLIAKVIAHASTRSEALDRLAAALDRTLVAGPHTNIAFLAALCRARGFREAKFDTGFIDRNLPALGAVPQPPDLAGAAKGVADLLTGEAKRIAVRARSNSEGAASPWDANDAFQLCGRRALSVPVSINGAPALADVSFGAEGISVLIEGAAAAPDAASFEADSAVYVLHRGRQTVVRVQDAEAIDVEHLDTGGLVVAPMHGKVLAILVGPGASVSKGQRLAVIEAMKMEHALLAPIDGMVAEISTSPGGQIAEGARVMRIEAKPPEA
jgi:3-methylcrotonyl-CoA carboxylase alpha subunit